jgi:hypothetical protein
MARNHTQKKIDMVKKYIIRYARARKRTYKKRDRARKRNI